MRSYKLVKVTHPLKLTVYHLALGGWVWACVQEVLLWLIKFAQSVRYSVHMKNLKTLNLSSVFKFSRHFRIIQGMVELIQFPFTLENFNDHFM